MTRLWAGPAVQSHPHFGRPWIPVVALCTAFGLGSVAVAADGSRHGDTATYVFFWLGLLLIFVPIALVALRKDADRRERLLSIVLLGVALYLVSIVCFTYLQDEFIHLRNTQDILRTGHIFAFNPLLPTAAYYPGLAAVMAGFVDLTGLSPFASGVLVIGAARVLICACFFLVAERVTGSDLMAAVASLVYIANPMFLYWSSARSYENLALPLAAFVVWWLARTRQNADRVAQVVTVIAIFAVIVTHHVVGFALTALLGAWWLAERLISRGRAVPARADRRARVSLGFMTVVAGTTSLAWFLFVARPAASYLITNNILPALQQTVSVLLGQIPMRRLYTSGGYASPAWEPVAGVAAVGLLLLALPLGIYRAWRRRDHAPMLVAVGVAALYPLSLAARLAPTGVAVSGRSAEYVFAGLACVVGLLATDAGRWRRSQNATGPAVGGFCSRCGTARSGAIRFCGGCGLDLSVLDDAPTVPPVAQGEHRATRAVLFGWNRPALATGLLTLVFVGNVTIGTAFYERLPEATSPQGYPWSVQPDVISASMWARQHLGINQRFGANVIDASAVATYGEQDPVAENDAWPIFFAPEMNATVVHQITAAGVRYLFVDWRMTAGVPGSPGYYFSPQEPHAAEYTQAFPAAALRKFASAACTRLIYDSGSVEIFDVSQIENGSCVPALASADRAEGLPR
jgi:hypothetical protein